MNKTMFFSGLGIFIMELVAIGFYLLNKFSVTESTANTIVTICFISAVTLLSGILMIVGGISKE